VSVALQSKADRPFSATQIDAFKHARDQIDALVTAAEPGPEPTPTSDGEAAKQALEPALATLRDLTHSLKEHAK
jgi:hypothetical protein